MQGIKAKLALVNAANGLLSGIYTPFFGAWLAWRGMPAAEIGILIAIGLLLRVVVSPIAGIVADAINDRRAIMLALAILGFGFYFSLNWAAVSFVLLLAVPGNVASGAIFPLLESVTLRVSEREGFDYGRVRMWASILFIFGTIGSGLAVSEWGMGIVLPAITAILGFVVMAVFILPSRGGGRVRVAGMRTHFRTTFAEARELLSSKIFLVFAIAAGLGQGSHAIYYSYGGLHWRELGYSGWFIGTIWPLGVLAEIALMSMSLRVFRWLGATNLLMLGAAACALRWFIMGFDPPFWILIFAQFLHGMTFAMTHLGAMYFLLKSVPPRLAATAQSLYSVFWAGLGMGGATLLGGQVYDWAKGGTYFLMAVMGLASLIMAFWLSRIWNGERLTPGTSQDDNPAV